MMLRNRGQTALDFKELASAFVGALFGAIASLYTPASVLLIALSAVIGSVALVLTGRVVGSESRIRLRVLNFFILVLAFLALGGGWYAMLADGKERYSSLFVTDVGLRLRDRPSLGGQLVGSLSAGTEVFLLGRSWRRYRFKGSKGTSFDYWRRIRTREGVEGWVYGSFLEIHPPKRE